MKNSLLLCSSLFIFLLSANNISAQFSPLAKVNYSEIKDKILYIPTYESSKKYIDKWAKKGMYKKILDQTDKGKYYKEVWHEALLESGFAASNFKFTDISSKDHTNEQCKDCLLLRYKREPMGGDKTNVTALLTIAHPTKKIITRANVTSLDLSDKNDIRLMLNMLSQNLNLVSDLTENNDLTIGNAIAQGRKKTKHFVSSMSDKTFLIEEPDDSSKRGKKALAKLENALIQWDLSKTKMCSANEIKEHREAHDQNSFYLRVIPQYLSPYSAFYLNILLSTSDDSILQMYVGDEHLTAKSLLAIQDLLKRHGK